jgi:hypothetical protein
LNLSPEVRRIDVALDILSPSPDAFFDRRPGEDFVGPREGAIPDYVAPDVAETIAVEGEIRPRRRVADANFRVAAVGQIDLVRIEPARLYLSDDRVLFDLFQPHESSVSVAFA